MARIDIPFVVEKQQISQPTREKLVAGGKNYFYATFKVNDTWNDISNIKAVFVRGDVSKLVSLTKTDSGYECKIPWEVMTDKGIFCVGIFGGDTMLTGMEYVEVKQGCVTDGGEPLAPTPDWFSNIEKKVEPFVINLNESFVGDKTCDEIIAAFEEGREIVGVIPPTMPGSSVRLKFDVEGYGESGVTLMTSMLTTLLVIECTVDNKWSMQMIQLVTDTELENKIENAITTARSGLEKTENKVIQITANSTSEQYPSAKAVYNIVNATKYDLQTQIDNLIENLKKELDSYATTRAHINILGGSDNWVAEEVKDASGNVIGTRYGQTVNVNNAVITPNSKVDLQLSSEQMVIFYEKDLAFVAENEDGVVTIYCIGNVPENDYTLQATVTEVEVNG